MKHCLCNIAVPIHSLLMKRNSLVRFVWHVLYIPQHKNVLHLSYHLISEFSLLQKRGLAILVTCDYVGNRHGIDTLRPTNNDGNEMYTTFNNHFGYDVHRISNKEATKDKIMGLLERVRGYLYEYGDYPTDNDDEQKKVIVFAFAGHGQSVAEKDRNVEEAAPEAATVGDRSDYIQTYDNKKIMVIQDIVASFVGYTGSVLHIPKLFFFDACRGSDRLTAAIGRAAAKNEVNFRIDYANIPQQRVPAKDQWMVLAAQQLRDTKNKDVSLGDVMAEVRKIIYEQQNTLPETRDRLVTGPLKLWYRKEWQSYST